MCTALKNCKTPPCTALRTVNGDGERWRCSPCRLLWRTAEILVILVTTETDVKMHTGFRINMLLWFRMIGDIWCTNFARSFHILYVQLLERFWIKSHISNWFLKTPATAVLYSNRGLNSTTASACINAILKVDLEHSFMCLRLFWRFW